MGFTTPIRLAATLAVAAIVAVSVQSAAASGARLVDRTVGGALTDVRLCLVTTCFSEPSISNLRVQISNEDARLDRQVALSSLGPACAGGVGARTSASTPRTDAWLTVLVTFDRTDRNGAVVGAAQRIRHVVYVARRQQDAALFTLCASAL